MRLGRFNFGRALLVGAAIMAIAVGVLWSQRRPIAAGALDRALAARGVQASYEVKDIGFRTQRIEQLRLGDPANPDLTADWAEVSLAPSLGGVTVTAIDASGVRLHGRVVEGRVSWGEVDRLLPAPTGKPLTLPDIDVRLADTRVTLATTMGAFTAEVAGSGRLRNGFRGQVRATAPFAGRDGCRLEVPVALAQLSMTRRRPQLIGTLNAASSNCGTASAGPVQARFDVTLGDALDSWRGRATVMTSGIRQGLLEVAQAKASINFAGNRNDTKGDFVLASPASRYAKTRLWGLSANSTFGVNKSVGAGRVKIDRAIIDPAQVASLRRALAGAAGTPIGPLVVALSQAIARAGEGVSVDTRFAFDGGSLAGLSDLTISARGGGMLTLRNGGVLIDSRGIAIDADLALSGGGFPSVHGRLIQAVDASTRGVLSVAPYRAGNAQLLLAPLRFAGRRDGTMRIETAVLLDGPLGDGRAEGVRVPIVVQRASSGDIIVAPGCMPVDYRRIAIAGTVLTPGSITLCPTRGGAIVRSTGSGVSGGARTGPLRLTGRVGDQPLLLATSGASFDLGGPVLLSDFSAMLGGTDRRTRIDIKRVQGVARPTGLSGRFTGLSGNIARVPFLVTKGQGTWALAGGTLDVGGTMMVADEAAVARFNPLAAQGVKLRLKNGRITADAMLVEPESSRAITALALVHDLGTGRGDARLVVDALNFGKSLQPEAITPLTEGVVADVYGRIDGVGIIRWQGDRVTSSGRFRTDALDFAAAFGPVTGASGEVEFDDLIALSTPPGQKVKLALVNPGVEVKDGVIGYRLRPNQVVEIERGQWPFAGGRMVLEPASLDFGRSKPRTLTFRVVALDAAKFIEQLKLENIAATGIFDGTLPIVFDASGGQIVGGQIVARAGGGTLAYVGDVSNAETNTMAKLAFDALKSIRYGNLAIDLDGSLDGEIVSLVRFDGVNQSPVAPTGIAKSFTGLPFLFNIRVRAPFRGLVNTARSYQDPGLLLNRTVQPVASDPRP